VFKKEYSSTKLKELLGRPLNDIEAKYASSVIYYEGPMEIPLQCPRVSIIGSRQTSEKGLLEAEEITKLLVKNEVIIMSGLGRHLLVECL